jgi:hypothetical protein
MPAKKHWLTKSRSYKGKVVRIKLISGHTITGVITGVSKGGIHFKPLRKNKDSQLKASFFFPFFIPFAAILFIKLLIF